MSAPRLLTRIPDALPVLALLAAGLALLVPSRALGDRIDLPLAALVAVTSLGIDPRALRGRVGRAGPVVALAAGPIVILTLIAFLLSRLAGGALREGTLALGVAPAEVASVGLVGLAGGPAEAALAVLGVSLIVSVLAGPPALALLGHAHHAAGIVQLLGRFSLVVLVPLAVGLAVRTRTPERIASGPELPAASSILVALLVYASLSGTGRHHLGSAVLISLAFLAVSAAGAVVVVGATTLNAGLGLTVAMRDFAVAAALAQAAFGAGAAQVAGVYGSLMLILGALTPTVARRLSPARRARPPGTPGPRTPAG